MLPQYRLHSLKLLKALLDQEGYDFTDLSPASNVFALNERMGFQALDTQAALVPNLPWPSWPRRARISSDPGALESTLAGDDLRLYRDHAGAGGVEHFALVAGSRFCYAILRRERRKGLPVMTIGTQPAVAHDAATEAAAVVAAMPHRLVTRVSHVDARTMDSIELRLQDGRRVVWGNAESSQLKARVLSALLHRKAQVYDVSVPGSPTLDVG